MDNYTDPIIIDEKQCNGCMRCTFICSMGVIEIREKSDNNKGKTAFVSKPEYCMYCEACVIDCKNGAIRLNPHSGSLNIEKISDRLIKNKKSRFKLFRKKELEK